MAIITASELRNFSVRSVTFSERQAYQGRKGLLLEHRAQHRTTVFLSHSHSDQEYVADAVALLSKIGVHVYVDWQDASMPSTTSGVTAAKLKEKIKLSNKFVLLASPQAIQSNWVNWELGYGDSVKYIEHIALFPFIRDGVSSRWPDAEYLQIYPYIEREEPRPGPFSTQAPGSFYVKYPDGHRVALSAWLNA